VECVPDAGGGILASLAIVLFVDNVMMSRAAVVGTGLPSFDREKESNRVKRPRLREARKKRTI
jgi:hypothetical protein